MKKRRTGIEHIKSRYGWYFVLPWLIGVILFFAIPIIQSIIFSFSEVTVNVDGIVSEFVKFKNYNNILFENPDYFDWLSKSVVKFIYSLPIIMLLSLTLALLLNQKFKGRIIFRAIYFLPVIIATGAVLSILNSMAGGNIDESSVNESISSGMFSVNDIMAMLDLPDQISVYVQQIVSNIFDLVWNSGIQIILFLAGLQSIPATLYEASRVEGATKWEEFWFITFPMLSNVTLLVGVFTMVDLFVNDQTVMIANVYKLMQSAIYDRTSAMLWFYFLVVGGLMFIIVMLYRNVLQKRWS